MSERFTLVLAGIAGGLLGALFFGGLWWTVRKGLASKQPAFWFLGSLLLRMSIAVAGFYCVSGRQWERLLSCLLGFVIARIAVGWLGRLSGQDQTRPTQEADHAH